MKLKLLIGAAALSLSTVALAQDTTTAPPPPANDMSAQQMPQTSPPDPNAGTPTGQVPSSTGMQPADPTAPQDPSAPVGSSANPVTVGGNATPPPTEAKDYPVCTRQLQDSCINPGEARRKGKGKAKGKAKRR